MVNTLSIPKIAILLTPLACLGIGCRDSSQSTQAPTRDLRLNSPDVIRFAGSDTSRAYFAISYGLASSQGANWRLIALDPKQKALDAIDFEIASTVTQVTSDGNYVAWIEGNVVLYKDLRDSTVALPLQVDSQLQVEELGLVNGRLAVSITKDETREIHLFDLQNGSLIDRYLLGRFGTWYLSFDALVVAKSVGEIVYGLVSFEFTRVSLPSLDRSLIGKSTAVVNRLGLTIDDSDGCVFWNSHAVTSAGQGQASATLYRFCPGETAASAVSVAFDDGWPVGNILDFVSTPYHFRVSTAVFKGNLVGRGVQGRP